MTIAVSLVNPVGDYSAYDVLRPADIKRRIRLVAKDITSWKVIHPLLVEVSIPSQQGKHIRSIKV
jgi:hypothetical protein